MYNLLAITGRVLTPGRTLSMLRFLFLPAVTGGAGYDRKFNITKKKKKVYSVQGKQYCQVMYFWDQPGSSLDLIPLEK